MLLIGMGMWACHDDEVCGEVTANELRMRFFLAGQEEPVAATIDTLSIAGLGRQDQPIYDMAEDVSLVELPLNPSATTSAFVLSFGRETDTLWVTYQSELHMISAECGFTLFFEIQQLEHTAHHIVSVSLANPYVTNVFDDHVQIFIPDTGTDD